MKYQTSPGYTVLSRTGALLDRVESADVDFEVHLASSLRIAIRIASELPVVRALTELVRTQPTATAQVLERIEQLAAAPVDPDWASPHEAALLALLVVVRDGVPSLAPIAAASAKQAPNASWVRRLVDEIQATATTTPADFVVREVRVVPGADTDSAALPPLAVEHGAQRVNTAATPAGSPYHVSRGFVVIERGLRGVAR